MAGKHCEGKEKGVMKRALNHFIPCTEHVPQLPIKTNVFVPIAATVRYVLKTAPQARDKSAGMLC